MNDKVSVFVCGVQKGGTTSLYAHFLDHQQLQAPRRKEIHFFDDETQDWSNPRYHELDDWFDEPNNGRLRFDITPIYTFWPPSVARLKAYNPQAKLICLFRDPIERAWSHWKMEYSRDADVMPFAQAIREGRDRIDHSNPLAQQNRVYTYVERGFYGSQIQSLQDQFPAEQLLFLRSQDLRDNHSRTLKQISNFLGINDFPDSGPKREHEAASVEYPSELTMEDQLYLSQIFAPELEKFRQLTNIDTSEWLTQKLIGQQSNRAGGYESPPILSSTPPSPATAGAVLQNITTPAVQAALPEGEGSGVAARPNILLIIADDLNAWIGALGSNPDVKTPNIDALARRGTLFSKAYCAAPYCNASRMAFFTGLLPKTTGVYANENYWEEPDRKPTYIESLRAAGYTTFGAGKVFHGGFDYATAGQIGSQSAAWREAENRQFIWDEFQAPVREPLPAHRPLNKLFDFANFSDVHPMYHHFDWGPLTQEEATRTPDELTCQAIESYLQRQQGQPFFCAAGLYKPHLPWHAPKEFFDLYDPTKLSLPKVRLDDLDDVPPTAQEWATSPNDHGLVTERGVWREAVQGYLAAISYCDALVGRIIAALDASPHADNTIVALVGDNGFHLGEKLHWRKFVLWEEATRVPLIIVPPRGQPSVPSYNNPVSLIDLFPTLFDMIQADHPVKIDGQSLMSAMSKKFVPFRPVTMTWGQGNVSVRFAQWRYTKYAQGGEELYDHHTDPQEWTNLIADKRFDDILNMLRYMS